MIRGVITVELTDSGKKNERGAIINFRMRMLNIESRMFVIGPAAAEIAISLFGFLKFMGFIGTGFA
jgi:hypothetical protein